MCVLKGDAEEMVSMMKKHKVELRNNYVLLYASDVVLDEEAVDYIESEGIKHKQLRDMRSGQYVLMRIEDAERYIEI